MKSIEILHDVLGSAALLAALGGLFSVWKMRDSPSMADTSKKTRPFMILFLNFIAAQYICDLMLKVGTTAAYRPEFMALTTLAALCINHIFQKQPITTNVARTEPDNSDTKSDEQAIGAKSPAKTA